ncbi:MAG: hypothetical protein HZB16_03605 [Armatimonadetes bacterium]|nr:hypothetical protein [Armatimonadota bacterium]
MGILLSLSFVFLTGCASIPPGYVGIKVNALGRKKGVEAKPIGTGRVAFNPMTETIYRFPTFMQTVNWTMSKDEGAAVDQAMRFNSAEGAQINVDVSLAFTLDPEKVPVLFQKFRRPIDEIVATNLRSQVRDALNVRASTMPIVKIYGEEKGKLLEAVKADLIKKLEPDGFRVEMLSFISDLRLDPKIQDSITASIAATNQAVAAENKVRESKALAQQKIEEAKGQAEANRELQASLTDTMVRWQQVQNQKDAVTKWDGKLPTVSGDATPMIQLPAMTPAK